MHILLIILIDKVYLNNKRKAVIMDFGSVSIEVAKYTSGVLLAIVSKLAYDGSRFGQKEKEIRRNVCENHENIISKISQAIENISEQKSFINKIFDTLTEILERINKIEKISMQNKQIDKELKPLSCLIIDDMDEILGITCRMIENASAGKIKCVGTDNISEAKKHLCNTSFDFIMIDYCLGKEFSFTDESYTGYDFYKYVINTFPGMKCIVYSGKNPDRIESEIADIFIEKPFNVEQILYKINSVLK